MSALVPSLFLLGLASGVHCVGMCGGFVAAFAGRRVIPIRPAEPPLWRRLQPYASRAMAGGPYVAGLFWGWLPCGLVYGALAAAAFAGSAAGGALAMAAYGLGTLPWLMGAGFAFGALQGRWLRSASGALVLAFGVYGRANGTTLGRVLCL